MSGKADLCDHIRWICLDHSQEKNQYPVLRINKTCLMIKSHLSWMMIGMRSVMDEIQVPLPTQSRCPESPRCQHSWLMCKTNKIILHTKHYFKELVTVKVAVELIMIVKRTPVDLYDMEWAIRQWRWTCVLICQFKLQADRWLSGILATEVMVLCLACFENQGQQKL